MPLHIKVSLYFTSLAIDLLYPLFQEGGGLLQSPPFRIFPRTIFVYLLRLPYVQFTQPLSRYPCIYEQIFKKFFTVKKVGVWGVATNTRPEKEGAAAK